MKEKFFLHVFMPGMTCRESQLILVTCWREPHFMLLLQRARYGHFLCLFSVCSFLSFTDWDRPLSPGLWSRHICWRHVQKYLLERCSSPQVWLKPCTFCVQTRSPQPSFLSSRHDAVIKLLRDRGANLVLTGNNSGVLMCEVSIHFFVI